MAALRDRLSVVGGYLRVDREGGTVALGGDEGGEAARALLIGGDEDPVVQVTERDRGDRGLHWRILECERLAACKRDDEGRVEERPPHANGSRGIAVLNRIGPDGAPTREGHGLVGMRERAAVLGGSLQAVREDGRFRLQATLPYESSER